MTERHDDFDRGLANRRAVLGDTWVDRSVANATAFNADFQDLITRYAWHSIWGRPGLDHETRRLLVLGMTMGSARWEEFELHCKAAIEHGVSIDKIRETLMQGAIYCGVPAANTAFKLATDLLRAHGDAASTLPPRPLGAASRAASHHTFSSPQLHVTLQGDGPPVVLSHALGLDLHMWDDLARHLAGSHAVLRYSHRGHGESAVPPGPYEMDDLVDDAARLIREWGRGPVTWVGLSMGGMVGQGLAVRHPELLRGVVLANTTARYPAEAAPVWASRIAAVEAGGVDAVADGVVERYLGASFRAAHPDLVAALRSTLLRSNRDGYLGCCYAVAEVDWLDRLDTIRLPTLVIAGSDDAGTTPAMGRAIAERITDARFEVIEGASHLSVAEQPERFAALVDAFLASPRMTSTGDSPL